MRNNITVTLTVWSVLALAGCATTNDVLFITKTSLGLDFDSKPASASIAYDRIEGYLAPRYDNGEVPPVVASIKSDAKIFNPKIRQVYATGDAAVIAVSKNPKGTLEALDPKKDGTEKREKKLKGKKELMFFGTTTTTGLKVGFTTYVPDSLVFGFKRKEYSFIPLGTQPDPEEPGSTYDVYPSVLASIDTAATAGKADETGKPGGDTSLSNAQYFATGRAARELAANDAISGAFKEEAQRGLATAATGYSRTTAAEALRAYIDAPGLTKPQVRSRYEEIRSAAKKHASEDFLSPEDFIADTRPETEKVKEKVAQSLGLTY